MTSDITTTTTPTLTVDLTSRAGCIRHGLSAKEALLDSARAFVTYHGPIEEWVDEMGMGKSSRYNYQAALRKEGEFKFLPAKKEVHRATTWRQEQRVANSTAWKTQQPQPPEPEIIEAEVKELGEWAHRPTRTREEEIASYSQVVNDKLTDHIETIYMALDEAKSGECVLSPRNRELLTLLSKSIQYYDQIIDHSPNT